jgi:hypothetical protein
MGEDKNFFCYQINSLEALRSNGNAIIGIFGETIHSLIWPDRRIHSAKKSMKKRD